MKYDLSNFPVDKKGNQMKDETGELLNYGGLLIAACANGLGEDGQPVKGKEKMKFYAVYQKLIGADAANIVELTSEDVGLLAGAVLNFSVVLAGQARKFLDG